MSTRRYTDGFEHRFNISVPTRDDPTLVVCPDCSSKSFILPLAQKGDDAVRFVCHCCGSSKESSGTIRAFYWRAENPTDGYFGMDLWLQTPCVGQSLWAFNVRHLNMLSDYISATLREREQNEYGWRNASIASRLPKWMISADNRKDVMKAIATLRAKSESTTH